MEAVAESRHPGCRHWSIEPGRLEPRAPEAGRLELLNVKAFAAAPDRVEHWLQPVARIGDCVIESATSSEPLYFAHVNVSDEFNILMPTGDVILDHAKGRTFFFDAETDDVLGYTMAGAGDVLVNPVGVAHWPGQLKDPYTRIPEAEERRKLFALVYCSLTPPGRHDTLQPPERRRVRWEQPEAPVHPEFASMPTGQGFSKMKREADRVGTMNLFALGGATSRKPHALSTIASVGDTQIDLFLADGPRGTPFPNPDGLYLLCFDGRARVAVTEGGRAVADLHARTGDLLKLPPGWSFDTFPDREAPRRSIFLVFRRTPEA